MRARQTRSAARTQWLVLNVRFSPQNVAVTFHELDVPAELDDKYVEAIAAHAERLDAARRRDDLSDIVGCSKELAESIARIVLDVRGSVLSDSADFGSVIAGAHESVERQPGRGLADSDDAVRRVAQSAKRLVTELGRLRNAVGTGHGRATLPPLVEEQARIATDATVVWARWMLRRLPSYLLSDVHKLIQDLDAHIFYKGDLTSRLEAVDLPNLGTTEARALGVAVGRRAVGETFNVSIKGVELAVSDPDRYPATYRAGLLHGLLFNEQGTLCTRPFAVGRVVDLLLVDERLHERLDEITPLIASSGWIAPPRGSSTPTLRQVVEVAVGAGGRLPAKTRDAWVQAWQR